jgi:hypothetical protein
MKFLREPLLHFAVAGAVLFAGYQWLNRGEPDAGAVEPVRIGAGEVQWLAQTFASQRLRTPTAEELRGLVGELANEELLAREATEMGLDKDDTIVRRRLAQKLLFIVDDTSRLAEPTEGDLRKYYEANAARFEVPAKVSFRQIYFNPQHRKDASGDASVALVSLSQSGGGSLADTVGDRILLDGEIRDADARGVTSMFGHDFAEAVFKLEPGVWSGPVKSGLGLHLVAVSKIDQAEQRPFENVRTEVKDEWLRERQEIASREYLARLREKYGVVIDDDVQALLSPGADAAMASSGEGAVQ